MAWFASASGLGVERVWWSNPKVVARSFPFATMSWLSTTQIGIDSAVVEDLDPTPETGIEDVRLHATGLRRVVVSIQCFDDPDSDAESSPMLRLEAAAAKLSIATHRDALNLAGFGVIGAGPVQQVALGQYVVELTGTVTSDVTEDIFSIQVVGLVPSTEIDFLDPFNAPDGAVAPVFYVGASAVDINTEAEVLANLTTTNLGALPLSATFAATSGKYAWVVIPASTAADTFTVDGFVGGFIDRGTVVVDGVTCDVWRSAHPGLGTFTAEIS